MSWEIWISKILDSLLLPPGLNILLIVSALLLIKKYYRLSIALILGSLLSLLLVSLPWFANLLLTQLETEAALEISQVKWYKIEESDGVERAIVVLAGGRISQAAEYGNIDLVSSHSLQRIQYASWLHKKTNLPILLSGGSVFNEPTPEAVLMNQAILSHFDVAPSWIESQSKNTAENAIYCSEILKANKISEILLVTHAWHMPRAKRLFEQQGISVISAPTAFLSRTTYNRLSDYLPSALALKNSQLALHEMLGNLWYRLRY